jgi:hypothetical protein
MISYFSLFVNESLLTTWPYDAWTTTKLPWTMDILEKERLLYQRSLHKKSYKSYYRHDIKEEGQTFSYSLEFASNQPTNNAIKFYEGIGGRKWCLAIKTLKF